jgi:hypothetical protein
MKNKKVTHEVQVKAFAVVLPVLVIVYNFPEYGGEIF